MVKPENSPRIKDLMISNTALWVVGYQILNAHVSIHVPYDYTNANGVILINTNKYTVRIYPREGAI